ncbi:MAG TPA: ATP-binding protein [Candidatus Polarisedimenticolia bacterium]|nr:ATP-binding protein [Candidatus Polarisedimenticolia bacterium]
MGRNVRLRLESRIAYVDLVHEMAEGLARAMGFAKPMALNIALAVREAVINAIKHGNAMDASKQIEVNFEQDDGLFRVRVLDQGAGFDWSHTANPLDRENIFRTSGRGIFFMNHFVDRVEFQRRRGKGTEVVLEKRILPAGRAGRGAEVIKRRKG